MNFVELNLEHSKLLKKNQVQWTVQFETLIFHGAPQNGSPEGMSCGSCNKLWRGVKGHSKGSFTPSESERKNIFTASKTKSGAR